MPALHERAGRARQISPGRVFTSIQVVGTMGAAWVALRALPYSKALRAFEPPSGRPIRSAAYRARVLRMAGTFGRIMFGEMPCLPQALAARWLLGRAGYATDLRIGIAPDKIGKAPFAHAWLEENGTVVLGGRSSAWRYLPFEKVAKPANPGSA